MSSNFDFRLVNILVNPPAPALCPSSLRDPGDCLEMAVARTTETKHQRRCHYFWGCGKWSVRLMTTLWLPGALFQLLFGIFILTKPFVVKCAKVLKGSEGQWAMPHPQPHVNSGVAAPFEKYILICSWLRAGLWWPFPGDFQPELQGAQAPARAHTESRDGLLLAWLSLSCKRWTKRVKILSLCDLGQVSASMSVIVATEAFSNMCSYWKV